MMISDMEIPLYQRVVPANKMQFIGMMDVPENVKILRVVNRKGMVAKAEMGNPEYTTPSIPSQIEYSRIKMFDQDIFLAVVDSRKNNDPR